VTHTGHKEVKAVPRGFPLVVVTEVIGHSISTWGLGMAVTVIAVAAAFLLSNLGFKFSSFRDLRIGRLHSNRISNRALRF